MKSTGSVKRSRKRDHSRPSRYNAAVKRIFFIHWNREEAEQRAQELRRLGFEMLPGWEAGLSLIRQIDSELPDAVIISLSQMPSHGREVGRALRQRRRTRHIPLVYVGGEPAKVAGVQALLPDARYCQWDQLPDAILEACERKASNPVIPPSPMSYPDSSLQKKLGIRSGLDIYLAGAPNDFQLTLGRLPEGVRFVRGTAPLALVFAADREALDKRFTTALHLLPENGRIWLMYPKKSSGLKTDLTQEHVRAAALQAGLVDYKVAAIDATWTGLLFTWKRESR